MKRIAICAVAIGLALAGAPASAPAQSTGKILKFIPQADLRVLDPVWTSATITRNHGYMVYDTLFGVDNTFTPRPQMVETWSVSEDQLTYSFTLRPGLKFHDGPPVRSADCIAAQNSGQHQVEYSCLGKEPARREAE